MHVYGVGLIGGIILVVLVVLAMKALGLVG